jgi:hypothetical protein
LTAKNKEYRYMGQDHYCAICGKAPKDETGTNSHAINAATFADSSGGLMDVLGAAMSQSSECDLFGGNFMQAMMHAHMQEIAVQQTATQMESKAPGERKGEFASWFGDIVVWTAEGEVISTKQSDCLGYGKYQIQDRKEVSVSPYNDDASLLCHRRCFECLEQVVAEICGFGLRKDVPGSRILDLDFVQNIHMVAREMREWGDEEAEVGHAATNAQNQKELAKGAVKAHPDLALGGNQGQYVYEQWDDDRRASEERRELWRYYYPVHCGKDAEKRTHELQKREATCMHEVVEDEEEGAEEEEDLPKPFILPSDVGLREVYSTRNYLALTGRCKLLCECAQAALEPSPTPEPVTGAAASSEASDLDGGNALAEDMFHSKKRMAWMLPPASSRSTVAGWPFD